MREDAVHDVVKSASLPFQGLVSWIRSNRPAAEIAGYELEDLVAVSILADRNTWPYFPSNPNSRAGADCDREASFTVEIA